MSRTWMLLGIMVVSTVMVAVVFMVPKAHAAASLTQTATNQSNNSATITATFGAAATANRLLIAVCNAGINVSLVVPTGFSTAISQAATPNSQAIFYKVAAGGETSVTCGTGGTATFIAVHIYEYSGVQTTSPLGLTGSANGTGTAVSSGSITTTTAESLLFAAVTIQANTAFSAWNNSFTERNDFPTTGGNPNDRRTYGGADRNVTATGTYNTTATAGVSGAWQGQIVSFNLILGALDIDFVNSIGNSVSNPNVGMSAITEGFDCQTTTGTLGDSDQRIRTNNTTVTPQWTVAIAATAGATASWSSGVDNYDFNDGAGTPAGCGDGADADALAGRLTLNPSVGTSTPQAGCNNTGISLGASNSFAQGTIDSITLISASTSAGTNCYWDLTGVSVSQTIPVQQAPGTYTLNLTVTVTAT